MLNILRKEKVRKGVFIFVAVAVIATFAVSGILINKGDKDTSAALAQLNKHSISVREYLDSYRAVQHQIDLFFGGKQFDRSRINIKGEAWDRLLLLDHAKKENIHVSDKEVVEWITSQEGFKNKGVFDDTFYKMYIERAMRMTPRQFEEEIRQMLIIRKVSEKLKDGLGLTDEKLKELYAEQKTEKDIQLAILPKDGFASQVTTTDKDIDQLYSVVKDQLTSPEKIKIKYVLIAKDKADDMKDALQDKTSSLDEIAKKYGLEIKETSFFSRQESLPELKNAGSLLSVVFSAEPNTDLDWVATDSGSYKAELVEKQPEHLMSKEEGRSELIRIFSEQKASELALSKLKELKTKMANPDEFEKILKDEKIEPALVEKYKKGMYPSGIWPSDNLEKAAAKLKTGEISDPFELPKGAGIIKITKVYGTDDKKFAEEKEAFKTETSSKMIQEATDKLLEKLRENLSLNLELLKDIFPAEDSVVK